ncbi:MAG: ABC transporter ATP-binding protein [Candidatus Omnitrophica bacterium]|nr:ABC transporter ATP-binding protein [Candidatus Omnitrophota bacterium]MCF7894114.1 ABC transporter ATP-binding protein [Candidatus Omnitrophota bacterium]
MSPFLEVEGLTKFFVKKTVLKNLYLKIKKSEIYGVLGPNGAGKTTLIKCLVNLLVPDKGNIFFKGQPLEKFIHKYFGYLPENFFPPAELSAFQFLKYLGLSLDISSEKIKNILTQLELDFHTKAKNYSRGMIQKLGLAQVLIKSPEFIILDEPTLGLDPQAQIKILDLLTTLNNEGKTILFASHDLFHIEKKCKRISILDKGQIKYTGLVSQFLEKHNTFSLEEAYLKELE